VYSVVLLAALTAGGQTPDHHGCFSCGSCYGSCYGNYGIDSYNCYGGCYGSSWGGCHGCWGGYGNYYGGYYGNCGGCNGCYGGYSWDWSSCGCNGCWGAYNETSPYFVEPPPAAPAVKPGETNPPVKPGEPLPPPSKPGTSPKPPETVAPNRARLIVDVPPDAKLYIDDAAMKTPTDHRVYRTPDLAPGQTYYYEVRVEAQRDGKPISQTKRVLLRAGQEVRADFTDLTATTTAQAK
jgi:uncharacterized protein (TIGR03000 family)